MEAQMGFVLRDQPTLPDSSPIGILPLCKAPWCDIAGSPASSIHYLTNFFCDMAEDTNLEHEDILLWTESHFYTQFCSRPVILELWEQLYHSLCTFRHRDLHVFTAPARRAPQTAANVGLLEEVMNMDLSKNNLLVNREIFVKIRSKKGEFEFLLAL